MASTYRTGNYPKYETAAAKSSDVNDAVQKLDTMVDALMDRLHIPDPDEADAGDDKAKPSVDSGTVKAIQAIDALLDELQGHLGIADTDKD